jgi:hypothetical protein
MSVFFSKFLSDIIRPIIEREFSMLKVWIAEQMFHAHKSWEAEKKRAELEIKMVEADTSEERWKILQEIRDNFNTDR